MFRQRNVARLTGSFVFCTVLLAASHGQGADQQPAATPRNAADGVAIVPVHVGDETGEGWNDNGLQMDFLWCEPGKFVMGSPEDEPERVDDEDQVDVTLTQGFWLGKYEVTQEQWYKVMQKAPWRTKQRVRVAADSPAVWISWDDASLFCREFTRQERDAGRLPEDWEYVLPTEAQWEYACRAGTTTKFSFGDDDAPLFDYAWYGEQQREPQEMNARAVGRKLPNPWGFYDIHGNVVEWTRDWYNPAYPGGTDPYVGTNYNNRVTLRGGEWRLELRWSRSACRQNLPPSATAATVGFRLSLQQGNTAPLTPSPTVRLAVVTFESKGATVKQQRLAPALSGLVASDLAQYAELDILERQSAQDLANEAGLAQAGLTQGSDAGGRKIVAAYILTGACTVSGEELTVTAQLARPGIAKPEAEWTLDGAVNDLFRLEEQLTEKVVAALKIKTNLRAAPPQRRGESPILAVLPLINNSTTARLDDMQLAIAEMLQANLGEIEGIRLVERQKLDAIIAEQQLSLSGLVDPQTALQVGTLAGAQCLLTGSFLELGENLNLQVRIVETEGGVVIGSARVTGPSSEFSDLIDQLAERIIAALAIPLPESSGESHDAELYGRTLESTIHKNAGDRFRKAGNLARAVESYQQALLLEPYNFIYHIHLIQTQMELNDLQGAIQTGEHALQYPVEFERCVQKENLLSPLRNAYFQTGRYDAIESILERYGHVSDWFRMDTIDAIASARIKQKRFPEATAMMEKMAEEDVAQKGVLKSNGLQRLFWFHCYHSTSVVGISIKIHQEQAQKAIAIYERVLDAAEGVQNEDTAQWAQFLVPAAVNLITISDDNQKVLVLSPQQQAEYQERELKVFGWLPEVGLDRTFQLAVAHEQNQRWEEAVEAYRRFIELSTDVSYDFIFPNHFEVFGDIVDKRIEAMYRVGRIRGFPLTRADEAREAYQTLVREYGLSHIAGPDARVDMHKLGIAVEIPPQCAVICGGGTSNFNGWKAMLAAEGMRLHPLRKTRVTLGDLVPYPVAIVNHSSNRPLLPSEVLALRTYVAGGGSLLVIASTTWSPSSPIFKNSLLSFFDIEAGADALGNTRSTSIVPHPITDGITEFTAFNAVGLRAPEDASLIRAGDKTLLAAREYGRGRVVVAAAGQWHTPEILLVPEIAAAAPRKVVTSGEGQADFEQIRGLSPEPPLLRQTLRWLRESTSRDDPYLAWQAEWRKAVHTFCQAQARVAPDSDRILDWEDVTPAFERLVDSSPTAELKETSLWTAGECLLDVGHFNYSSEQGYNAPRRPLQVPWSNRATQEFSLSCDPRFLQRLVSDFKDSPLYPFARFRRACVNRMRDPRNGSEFGPNETALIASLVTPYQKLKLPAGTYAHAWARLQAGTLYFAVDDYENAAVYFDDVAETMPVSAEKGLALLNLAQCRVLQGDNNEARRRLAELDSFPSFDCTWGSDFYLARSMWQNHFFRRFSGDSRLLSEVLAEDMVALEKNVEFEKWSAERKSQRASRSR